MDFIVNQNKNTAVIVTNVERLNASNASELKAELLILNKSNNSIKAQHIIRRRSQRSIG